MTYFNQTDYVQYVCNCGSLKPISKIYFCRHCSKIRCGYCVCHEVDCHYCPTCVENLPSTEVRLQKNKCSHCFDCPCCFQTLSTRAVHTTLPKPSAGISEDGSIKQRKVYYLTCSLCRWSSRDAGIPDQSVATGGWPEQENPHMTRINTLIDFHKILASREKHQGEGKKFLPRGRQFKQIPSFGMTSVTLRKHLYLQSIRTQMETQQVAPAVASENVDELAPEIFSQPVDITKITTIEQRLHHPDVQAEEVHQLRLQHKQFLVKRSQRCRICEHNLIRPDFSSQSIRFKIHLAAFYHVPEVKIVTCEPLYIGKSSELLLKICNPTQHQTVITLLPLNAPMDIQVTNEKGDKSLENTSVGWESTNLVPALVKEEPKAVNVKPNAELVLPNSSLTLPYRDDAAEYDDTGDTPNFQDDPNLVVWRKGNKVVIRVHVTPYENEQNKPNDIVTVGFIMQYGYVNTISALDNKPPLKLDLKVKLYLTLGSIRESTEYKPTAIDLVPLCDENIDGLGRLKL